MQNDSHQTFQYCKGCDWFNKNIKCWHDPALHWKKEVKHVSYWFSVLLFNQLLCLFSEITMAVPSLSACQICMCLVFLHLSYALNYHSIVVVHLLPLWGKFPFVTCIFQSQTYRFIFVVNVHLTYIKWTKTEKELCFIWILEMLSYKSFGRNMRSCGKHHFGNYLCDYTVFVWISVNVIHNWNDLLKI